MNRDNTDTFKIIVGDIRKICNGFCSLLKYSIFNDEIGLTLSLFSADSAIVHSGNKHTYKIIMLNDTNNDAPLRVLFDIYRLKNPVHPDGHYAYYAKNVFLKAHETKQLDIDYNWKDCFSITADESVATPDDSWRGTCSSKEKYVIIAVLLDEQGHSLDKLTITQQLV
jgi:hypothetical protein